MNDDLNLRAELLISKYLDGVATQAEADELSQLIVGNDFVKKAYLESVLLEEAVKDAIIDGKEQKVLLFPHFWKVAVAAMLFISGVSLYFFSFDKRGEQNRMALVGYLASGSRAELRRDNMRFTAQQHMEILSNTTIVTGNEENTRVVLYNSEGSISLNTSTKLKLDYEGTADQVACELYSGKVTVYVNPQQRRRKYRFDTANGQFFVTGTRFDLTVNRGQTELEMEKGKVRVVLPGHKEAIVRTVSKGERVVVTDTIETKWSNDIPGLLAYWPLQYNHEEQKDQSGNGLNLQGVHNEYRPSIDQPGLVFDGKKDYLTRSIPEIMKMKYELSMSAWVNMTEFRKFAGIAGCAWDTGTSESGFGIYHGDRENEFTFVVLTDQNVDRAGYDWDGVTVNLEPEQWYHLVGTYDGKVQKLYVNGELMAARPLSGRINYEYNNVFEIGRFKDDNDEDYFNGQVGRVGIYSRPLSAGEIRNLYIKEKSQVSRKTL